MRHPYHFNGHISLVSNDSQMQRYNDVAILAYLCANSGCQLIFSGEMASCAYPCCCGRILPRWFFVKTQPRYKYPRQGKVRLNSHVAEFLFPCNSIYLEGWHYLNLAAYSSLLLWSLFLQNGLTAIHKAILAKKQAIFNFLLRESANPFVRDNVS